LYYESSDVPGHTCLVVPEMLRDQAVSEHHDELLAGHFSVKMYTPYKACYSTIAHAFIRKESKPSTIPLL